MAHLVPDDVQEVDVSGSTEDRGNSVPESDDFDGDDFVVDGSVVALSKFSEPHFLKRVLREELRGYVNGYACLATAVHAVMQESGFVVVNPVTGIPADRFCLPLPDRRLRFRPLKGAANQPFRSMPNHLSPSSKTQPRPSPNQRPWFRRSLSYSLPELVARSDSLNESVSLTFGRDRVVSGYLGEAKVCRLRLKKHRFVHSMRAIGHGNDPHSYHAKKVLEFWRMVKDGLALPLLRKLTERVGLPPPPCFMFLPEELKRKIFELLPGKNLARVGCVCKELRRLTSVDDLWKQKYLKEFGEPTDGITNWKQSFAREFQNMRRPWRVVAVGSIGYRQTAWNRRR